MSAALVSLAAFAILGMALPALASAGFCESKIAFDYGRPFEEMPALRSVPADHTLPFGPRRTGLRVRGGEIRVLGVPPHEDPGFSVDIPPRSGRFGNPDLPSLNWLVTAKLARVDRDGRVTELLAWKRRRMTGPGDNGGFTFDFSEELGFYRVEIAFRNGAGKLLGRFGQYFRVLPAVTDVTLTLNAASYSPGEAVSACLENFGTTPVDFGGCVGGDDSLYGMFYLQYLDGSQWKSPKRKSLCAGVGLWLGPGGAFDLGTATIPSDAPVGQYRAVLGGDVTAPFQVVPAG